MRLYTASTIKNGDDSIQILKNNGKHIQYVPAYAFKKALNQRGSIVIVEYAGKRYGFCRYEVATFLKKNCIECIDFISAQEKFNNLRNFDSSKAYK